MQPIIISFYTENTAYQLEILTLINSCRNLDIPLDIEGVAARDTWALNCAIKPFFIRQKLHQHRRPVFWVDADAVFLKKPDFTQMLQHDLGIRKMQRFAHDKRFRYCAGSMFFNYSVGALDFVEKWCDWCEKEQEKEQDPLFLDQLSLADLFEKGSTASLYLLPLAYAKIFDIDAKEITPEETVIEHRQISRLYKIK